MIACSGCIFRAAWYQFPPVATWIWLVPIFMLILSAIRRSSGGSMSMTAPFLVTIPIALFGALGPGNLFSVVGLLQIAIILAALLANWNSSNPTRRMVRIATLVMMLALIVCGTYNYYVYYKLTPQERLEMIPEHMRDSPVYFYLLPI